MPTPYGAEFRQDVIDVARKGEAPLAQIAKDFGLSVTTLKRWIAIAERKESGAGAAAAESAGMRELKNRTFPVDLVLRGSCGCTFAPS